MLLCVPAYLVDGVQQRCEQICVIVGGFALQDAHQSLQTHPSIHADLGQQPQTVVHLPETGWDQDSRQRKCSTHGLK